MDNQDIQENHIITFNESEKNPRLAGLECHKCEEKKSSAKEKQEPSSSLISKLHPKSKKKNIERENLLQIAAFREKSLQKLHYTQSRKGNVVRQEDEIILQLLVIHPHLTEMIQMT